MRRAVAIVGALVAAPVAAVAPATASWAPSPIATAWERQTALGYAPCKPRVAPLPADLVASGAAGDADNGEQSGVCEIRLAWDLSDADLDWVAWHEMCHLSTVGRIYRSGQADGMADPVHEHRLFRQCVRFGPTETGGY